jgi:hypothetical protein
MERIVEKRSRPRFSIRKTIAEDLRSFKKKIMKIAFKWEVFVQIRTNTKKIRQHIKVIFKHFSYFFFFLRETIPLDFPLD